MMQVLTPRGVLREVQKAVPICETRIDFNGRNKKFLEVAKDMEVSPTAIGLVFRNYQNNICFPPYENELFIGNLKTEEVKKIQQKLLSEGYYDFSRLSYQKAKIFEKTVFDSGRTSPYTSDFTSGIMSLEAIGIRTISPSDIFSGSCVGVMEADFGSVCNEYDGEGEDEQE
ncbi:MAG: hypothetical protein K2H52_11335 [Lachnospiraceae bacterium]|nr:hypothetical protein [Lachnospiraceae bacterium]